VDIHEQFNASSLLRTAEAARAGLIELFHGISHQAKVRRFPHSGILLSTLLES